VKIFPVVMAGGSGTRFWPLSRKERPKQFLPLAGDEPLLSATVTRLPPLARPRDTFVVCGPAHAAAARRMLAKLPEERIGLGALRDLATEAAVLEPQAKAERLRAIDEPGGSRGGRQSATSTISTALRRASMSSARLASTVDWKASPSSTLTPKTARIRETSCTAATDSPPSRKKSS